jgi:hexosaminidase
LDLSVVWTLETNFAEGGGHRAMFTLRNGTAVALTSDNWELYWNMAPRAVDSIRTTGSVTIEWINGDFYVMKPGEGFHLSPGAEVTIAYHGSGPMIKYTDGPAGLYVLWREADGTKRPYGVRDYRIAPFESPEQIHRGPGDVEPIPTAAWLFEQYSIISEQPLEQAQLIVPQPRSVTRLEGHVDLGPGSTIGFEAGLQVEAALLARFLDELIAGSVTTAETPGPAGHAIHLRRREAEVAGAYTLQVSPDGDIVIEGDPSGVFYGTQSLRALIPVEHLGREQASVRIPAVRIVDRPAFSYRGMHLDVARNFQSIDAVKHLIDAMAFYKLNRLHLNLTEDEGWRVQIEALPELTRVGAFRGHTTNDANHLQPSYGSGPFPDPRFGYGSGFYSRAQYVDLVRYARERHIEVIPEINVPGHSRAAVKSMEHRFRRLRQAGRDEEADRYRLIDPGDTSRYRSAQWYTDNVINVCRGSAFTFIATVIDELIDMHDEAGAPLRVLHTGGDEVPVGAWAGSPLCAEYLRQHPEIDNPKNLQKAFFRRVADYLTSRGVRPAGWEEIAMNFRADGSWVPNAEFTASNAIPYIWNSLWGAEDLGNRLANAGYDVVLCNVTNLYFDLAYNKDPREPGLYWAGFVDARDVFEFVPYDVLRSIKSTAVGVPYTDADFAGKERLTAEGRDRVLGMQGQLWSETIKGQDMLEYYYLPKMLGLAERAWYGNPDWGDIAHRASRAAAVDAAWNAFANAVGRRELPRLERLYGGYSFRLAPPGARIEGGRLLANTAYPGMLIRYTTDGTDPAVTSTLYTGPVNVEHGTVKLSTFDSRGRASLPTVIAVNQP